MKPIRILLVPFLLLAITSGPAGAQVAVEARVQKLEDSIRVLERRVTELEARQPGQPLPAATQVMPGNAKWRKLQRGMSESEVESILGSPSRVDAYGSFTSWQYGDGLGGDVTFDGGSRTVRSWHEPR